MKLTITDKNLFGGARTAFDNRDTFTLSGAGINAQYVAREFNYSPTGNFGVRPSIELKFEQVSVAEAPKPWTGEGLPPVGVEFERRFIDEEGSTWAWGKMIAHGDRRVFYVDRTGDEWSHAPLDMEFRPIRTPEQIAAEERLKAIDEMADVYKSNYEGHVKDGCQALYDAGYRKP